MASDNEAGNKRRYSEEILDFSTQAGRERILLKAARYDLLKDIIVDMSYGEFDGCKPSELGRILLKDFFREGRE